MRSAIFVCFFSIATCLFASQDRPMSYDPTPIVLVLRVPIAESFEGIEFTNKSYVILGDTHFDSPLVLDGRGDVKGDESFKEKYELYKFISKLCLAYQDVDAPEDILEFSIVADEKRFNEALEQHWDKIKLQYQGLKHFELLSAWYDSPLDVNTLIKVVPKNGESYNVNMLFSMTNEGWKLKSGFQMNDRFAQNLETAFHVEGGRENIKEVSVEKIPEALLPREKEFSPVEIILDRSIASF